MPQWMTKTLVVLITILTFGTISPSPHIFADNSEPNDSSELDVVTNKEHDQLTENDEHSYSANIENESFSSWNEIAGTIPEKDELKPQLASYVVMVAEEQAMTKFGPKISNVIGDEFRQIILPKIEEVMLTIADEFHEDELRNMEVTELPSTGNGEKIFHIFDSRTGEDLVRFHVRRDHPPMDGYWFNFHYHKKSDNYVGHYPLGQIFWDKNTPPKWMAS
jgi:hypothetical protein